MSGLARVWLRHCCWIFATTPYDLSGWYTQLILPGYIVLKGLATSLSCKVGNKVCSIFFHHLKKLLLCLSSCLNKKFVVMHLYNITRLTYLSSTTHFFLHACLPQIYALLEDKYSPVTITPQNEPSCLVSFWSLTTL